MSIYDRSSSKHVIYIWHNTCYATNKHVLLRADTEVFGVIRKKH